MRITRAYIGDDGEPRFEDVAVTLVSRFVTRD